jgi:hypothetical protein
VHRAGHGAGGRGEHVSTKRRKVATPKPAKETAAQRDTRLKIEGTRRNMEAARCRLAFAEAAYLYACGWVSTSPSTAKDGDPTAWHWSRGVRGELLAPADAVALALDGARGDGSAPGLAKTGSVGFCMSAL